MNISKLKNGVTLITDEVPASNTACIGFFVKAGSVDEDATNYGISHIIEHMMFKGTKTRSAQQISEEFDALGISINAFTGEEYTCYYAKTLPENLVKAAEIYSDMLMNSTYDEVELSKELMVILEEYKMYRNNPEYHAANLFSNNFFKGTNLEVDIIGTEDSIKNTTREKIMSYISKHYYNENTVICVTGKFEIDEITEYLESNFNLCPSGDERSISFNFADPIKVAHCKNDTEQSYIIMGTHIFGKDDPRRYALMILSKMLGGSMSSRLFKTIREEQGLAYSVGSYTDFMADTGTFMITAGVSNDKVEQAVKSIANEIKKLKTEGFSKEEFAKAKNIMKSSVVFYYEGIHNRMVEVGSSMLLTGTRVETDKLVSRIDAVTYEEVVAVAECINNIDNYSCLVYSNQDFNVSDWF